MRYRIVAETYRRVVRAALVAEVLELYRPARQSQ